MAKKDKVKKENKSDKDIKINRNVVYTFIAVILIMIIAGGFVYSNKLIQDKKYREYIKDYKKSMYTSVICEYSCPLKLSIYHNQTQMLPDVTCAKNCVADFKAQYNKNITKDLIDGDKLLTNIGIIINNCKTKSSDLTNANVNTTQFFACASKSLSNLKQNYSYLN
jgi:hypothetical protein